MECNKANPPNRLLARESRSCGNTQRLFTEKAQERQAAGGGGVRWRRLHGIVKGKQAGWRPAPKAARQHAPAGGQEAMTPKVN